MKGKKASKATSSSSSSSSSAGAGARAAVEIEEIDLASDSDDHTKTTTVVRGVSSLLNFGDSGSAVEAAAEVPEYTIERAKSGRAECKLCESKIENKSIRVGIFVDSDWGLFTKWQHLDCTVFDKAITDIECISGFTDLDDEGQEIARRRFAVSLTEVDQDLIPVDPDQMVRKTWNKPMQPSSDLLLPLLPYQKEGLGWMANQEESEFKGGILADEMGMGKTIQTIAAILHNRPSEIDKKLLVKQWEIADQKHGVTDALPRAGTLIVVPMVAIRQWQMEIARFTRNQSLSVTVYHGSERSSSLKDICKYDIVLTTYKIIETEYRKMTAGIKVDCKLCGKKFYPDKLRVHRKYFCGDSAQRTDSQSKTEKKTERKRQRVAEDTGGAGAGAGTGKKEQTKKATTVDTQSTRITGKLRTGTSKAAKNKVNTEKEEEESDPEMVDEKGIPIIELLDTDSDEHGRRRPAAMAAARRLSTSSTTTSAASVKKEKKMKKEEPKKSISSTLSGNKGSSRSPAETKRGSSFSKERPLGRSSVATAATTAASAATSNNKKKKTGATSAAAASAAAAANIPSSVTVSVVTDYVAARPRRSLTLSNKPKYNVDLSSEDEEEEEEEDALSSDYSRDRSVNSNDDEEEEEEEDCSDDEEDEESQQESNARKHYAARSKRGAAKPPAAAAAESRRLKDILSGGKKKKKNGPHNKQPSATAAAAAATAKGKRNKASSSSVQLEDSSSSCSELEGDRQRRLLSNSRSTSSNSSKEGKKGQKGKGSSGITLSKAQQKKLYEQEKKQAISATGSKSGKKRKKEGTDEDDADDDDDSGSEDYAGGSTKKTKRNTMSGKSKRKASNNNASSSGGDYEDDNDDSEVERDIRAALRLAAKAQRKQPSSSAAQSLLHLVSWFRIVLDEAHLIKDRSTSTTKAAFHLVSINKWCLTGTPLQNRVGELYSLIRFLRIDPHGYYFCKAKNCGCKSLEYNFTKGKCDDCGHSAMQHFCHFNKHVLNPIKRSGYTTEGRRAMIKLKNEVLDNIMLRRTKVSRAEDINLPPRIVRVRKECMDEKEEDFYQALYTQSQAEFNTYVARGTVLNNYAHIFDILIRLRQAVDHPYLVIHSTSSGGSTANAGAAAVASMAAAAAESSAIRAVSGSHNSDAAAAATAKMHRKSDLQLCGGACGLCGEPFERIEQTTLLLSKSCCSSSESAGGNVEYDDSETVESTCGHRFCRLCIREFMAFGGDDDGSGNSRSNSGGTVCPVCDKPLTVFINDEDAASIAQQQKNGQFGSSKEGGGAAAVSATTTNSSFSSSSSLSRENRAAAAAAAVSSPPAAVLAGTAVPTVTTNKTKRKNILDNVDLSRFQSSTKIEALMQELIAMRNFDYGSKAIVFSQFVSMLDIVEHRIQLGGLRCTKLVGSMSLQHRDAEITAFREDPDVNVLLISLKAGGVALNLTVASRIFLLDPWWNPAAEMQAIDRTHRIGQFKPIVATRFIIQNSIEERILQLQEKKHLVFNGTVGGDAAAMARLTVDDMRFLFQ